MASRRPTARWLRGCSRLAGARNTRAPRPWNGGASTPWVATPPAPTSPAKRTAPTDPPPGHWIDHRWLGGFWVVYRTLVHVPDSTVGRSRQWVSLMGRRIRFPLTTDQR